MSLDERRIDEEEDERKERNRDYILAHDRGNCIDELEAKNAELRAALSFLKVRVVEAIWPEPEKRGATIKAGLEKAERALKPDPSRASGSSDGSALGDVLRAADEWELSFETQDGREKIYRERGLVNAVRRYRKERGDVDPSTPTKGCGVCAECAASGSDPERCMAGIGKERGE